MIAAIRAWAAGLAAVAIACAGGCGGGVAPGVLVKLRVEHEVYRPHYALMNWRWATGGLANVRIPEIGQLPATGAELGSVRIDLAGAAAGERQIELQGMREDHQISGARAAIVWMPGETAELSVTFGCVPGLAPATDCPPTADAATDAVVTDAGVGGTDARAPDQRDPGGSPDGLPIETGPAPPDAAIDAGTPDGTAPPVEAPPKPTPAGVDLDTGLLLYLKLNDGGSASSAVDSSGNGNLTQLSNLDVKKTWVPGHAGQAVELPGPAAPGWLTVTSSPSLNRIGAGVSISLWLRTGATAQERGTLLARAASAGGVLYRLSLVGGRPALALNSAHPASASFTSSATLPREQWVHLALVYDRAMARLYVNGQAAGSIAYQIGFAPEVTPVIIGASPGVGTPLPDPFAGRLDEVALYARPLSLADVRALAAGSRPQAH